MGLIGNVGFTAKFGIKIIQTQMLTYHLVKVIQNRRMIGLILASQLSH